MSTIKDFIIKVVGYTQTGNELLAKIKSLLNPTTKLLLAINYNKLYSVAKNKTLAKLLRSIKFLVFQSQQPRVLKQGHHHGMDNVVFKCLRKYQVTLFVA